MCHYFYIRYFKFDTLNSIMATSNNVGVVGNELFAVGNIVWSISNPSFVGVINNFLPGGEILVSADEGSRSFSPGELTKHPNRIIVELHEKLKVADETVEELRRNYWNIHQEVIRLKNSKK